MPLETLDKTCGNCNGLGFAGLDLMLKTGTFHSTRGSARVTENQTRSKIRLAILGAVVLVGSLMIIWMTHTTWVRLDRLQREFAALKADNFYLGVRTHSDIRRLNDGLLRYRLHGDVAAYENFRTETETLNHWFETSRTNALTPIEREFFEQVGSAYHDYQVESLKLLDAGHKWFQSKAGAFPASYEKLQKHSQRLLDLCEAFVRTQRLAFDSFLMETQATLAAFQRLLQLSLVLLLALTTVLIVLVYRGMIAPLRDRLTQSQAVIARQEKLASLGVLAAGVAHEIRNPLTAIKLRLFSLKQSLPSDANAIEDAVIIGNEINRLERIVKEVLQFARPSEPELVVIPAQRLMQEVHDLLNLQLQKNAVQLTVSPSEPACVRVDTQQIKQVLINLIQNAADSIGREGVVGLRVHAEAQHNRRAAGAKVVLEVTDNGNGIPPEVQQRLFDPFFTTKAGGAGLGLPIAARIVEKHGGEIRYHTQLNRGTTFAIVLPRVRENES